MDGVQINNHSYANINMLQILNLILSNEVFQEDINTIYASRHAYRHPSSDIEQYHHDHENNDSSSSEEDENKKEMYEK